MSNVRAAHADTRLSAPRAEEWLLIAWSEGEPEPTQYWLSTLPEEIGFADLVDLAQLRPRGAPDPARTARAELDRHRATTAHRGLGPEPAPMPVRRTQKPTQLQPIRLPSPLVTH